MPLPPPLHPLEGITMEFITNLPQSTPLGVTAIRVSVDRLTNMAIYFSCRKDSDSPELALMFLEHVICKHGIPDNIITDCTTQFTRWFCTWVCSYNSINHRLYTAFNPHNVGQTESQNRTTEHYLWLLCNYEKDNWVKLLPLAELEYNNSMHASMRKTPFWAHYHCNPKMQIKPPKLPASHPESEILADVVLDRQEETHWVVHENLLEGQKE